MALMSAREFARHRQVDPSQVTRWKKKGFFKSALVRQKGKKRVLINSTKANEILEKNLDPNHRKGGATTTKDFAQEVEVEIPAVVEGKTEDTFIQARTWSERYRAAERKLNYEIKQNKWVPKAQVRDEAFKAGRIFRDTMLNIPPRVAAILAAETDGKVDEHKIGRILIKEIEQALKEVVRMMSTLTVD
jgi:hypothetical protein